MARQHSRTAERYRTRRHSRGHRRLSSGTGHVAGRICEVRSAVARGCRKSGTDTHRSRIKTNSRKSLRSGRRSRPPWSSRVDTGVANQGPQNRQVSVSRKAILDMLKITPTREHASLKVHLCGQLTKEYIPEIERLLAGEDGAAKNTSLDLANVTFVDRGAMMFLCSARSRN